jgi:hypothetical protein
MTDNDNTVEKVGDLHAYLLDHLSGADAAITVVQRLRKTQAGTFHGQLFAELDDEFSEERVVLSRMLEALGGGTLSLKRTVGRVAGAVMQIAAGGDDGDLSLFRTLESLAVGVQGKRLLWRVLDRLSADLPLDGHRRPFREFEAQAVDQWRRIEEHRAEVARQTFIAG